MGLRTEWEYEFNNDVEECEERRRGDGEKYFCPSGTAAWRTSAILSSTTVSGKVSPVQSPNVENGGASLQSATSSLVVTLSPSFKAALLGQGSALAQQWRSLRVG